MTTPLPDLRLNGARLADGRLLSIDIAGDQVAALRPNGEDAPEARRSIELGGALVLPGLTDGHVHLDKTLLGVPWRPHQAAASIRARIEAEKDYRRSTRTPLAEQGAEALLEAALRRGTTSLRTHVDIDDVAKLDNLTQLLTLRERWADRMQIQIVAFPQSGILSCAPAAAYLDEALRMGADLIGGLDPVGIDGDRDGHLAIVFALAEKHGRGIDIHLHDGGSEGLDEIDDIIARTRAGGLGGQVTISHAFALADADERHLDATADALRESGVAILSSIPGGDRCPPIPRLRARGVEVFFGSDNIRDCWNPSTVIGMVDRAMLGAYRFGLRRDEDIAALLDHVTTIPSRICGLGAGEIRPGARADIVAFEAPHAPQVIVERQLPSLIVSRGKPQELAAPPVLK
ncbi:cytosine deaminase [Bosea sp. WAO]|uniref:amidohydrolase n=1 Tax=Bosea sp. WAO TaxID=406341 RepID=UPI0007497734|nr:amidohydrolase [Bosea sp. WAO]KUL94143.1 cytosine deaminase [Bosea sp. WAO]